MSRKATLAPTREVYNAWMLGISAMHGGHQVAQRLMNRTLPRKSPALTSFPSRLVTLQFAGIVPRTFNWFGSGNSEGTDFHIKRKTPAAKNTATINTTGKMRSHIRVSPSRAL